MQALQGAFRDLSGSIRQLMQGQQLATSMRNAIFADLARFYSGNGPGQPQPGPQPLPWPTAQTPPQAA
jgi:hypothetical protein